VASIGLYNPHCPHPNPNPYNNQPKDVRGGFICEEMGMGKTVITLGLILANPATVRDSLNEDDAEESWGSFAASKHAPPDKVRVRVRISSKSWFEILFPTLTLNLNFNLTLTLTLNLTLNLTR
jgi:hypothetical protein